MGGIWGWLYISPDQQSMSEDNGKNFMPNSEGKKAWAKISFKYKGKETFWNMKEFKKHYTNNLRLKNSAERTFCDTCTIPLATCGYWTPKT